MIVKILNRYGRDTFYRETFGPRIRDPGAWLRHYAAALCRLRPVDPQSRLMRYWKPCIQPDGLVKERKVYM